jgi:glutamate dehydrogenase (NADP+)
VAEKLVEMGAIPLTFSDSSGFIYEPDGFDAAKVRTVEKIKSERGTRVGRYIMASTSAKFKEAGDIYNVPCDLVFSMSTRSYQVTDVDVATLSSNGCQGMYVCMYTVCACICVCIHVCTLQRMSLSTV